MSELVTGLGQVETELLESARHPHGPARVAEETLDLADDGRHRERGELDAPAQFETVDRLDEADGADLDDVLHGFAAGAEPGGSELHQSQVEFDQGVADVRVFVRAFLKGFEPLEEGLGQGSRVHRSHLVVRGDLREVGECVARIVGEVVLRLFRGGCRRRPLGMRFVEPG